MRDTRQFKGTKKFIQSIEDLRPIVRSIYPTATFEGSIGAWSFWVAGECVGEAWLHRTKDGWWYKIKQPEGK